MLAVDLTQDLLIASSLTSPHDKNNLHKKEGKKEKIERRQAGKRDT